MKLSVDVSKEEKALLEKIARAKNVSVEKLMKQYVDAMVHIETMEIHPDVKKVTGVLPAGAPINVREEYADYQKKKQK